MWVGKREEEKEKKKFIRQQEPDQVVKEGGTGGGLRKGKEEEEIGESRYCTATVTSTVLRPQSKIFQVRKLPKAKTVR